MMSLPTEFECLACFSKFIVSFNVMFLSLNLFLVLGISLERMSIAVVLTVR